MKIVFLLLSLERSGGVRVTTEILNQLSDLGHNCTLIVPVQNELPFKIRDNVNVIRINKNRGNGKMSILGSMFDLSYAIPKCTDVIVASYYLTAYSAFLAKFRISTSKLFYIVQGYEPNYFRHKGSKTQWFSYLLASFSYHLPLKKSVISHWLANMIIKKGYKNLHVINNGINSQLFKPLVERYINNDKVIMTIANKRPNRGFFDFCDAVAILWGKRQDFKVLIIGFDEQIVMKLYAPFSFLSPQNDYELINAYNQATIYVTCSHEEGFGLTPLEAMSCGTPVVCTDSGGIRDFAKDGENCLMLPVGDIQKIANAMDKLIDNHELRSSFITNGRQTAMNFDWNIIGHEYNDFFSDKNI